MLRVVVEGAGVGLGVGVGAGVGLGRGEGLGAGAGVGLGAGVGDGVGLVPEVALLIVKVITCSVGPPPAIPRTVNVCVPFDREEVGQVVQAPSVCTRQ